MQLELEPRAKRLCKELFSVCPFPDDNKKSAIRFFENLDAKNAEYFKDRLHSGNKISCRAFERETGLTLPKTNSELLELLSAWSGNPIPIAAPRVSPKVNPSTGNERLDEYLKPMTPMNRGKIANQLIRLIQYQSEIMKTFEFIEVLVKEKRIPHLYFTNTGVLKHAAMNQQRTYLNLSVTVFAYFIHLAGVGVEMPALASIYEPTKAEENAWRYHRLFKGDEKEIVGQTYVFDGMNWCRKKDSIVKT
jgi:hypothetical protein